VNGLEDELTIAQLASIRYELNSRGLIEIESKDKMCERGLESPDRAEALMLAFADRTPGIMRYYEALNRQMVAAEGGLNNPKLMRFEEPDDSDVDDMMQVYEQALHRIQADERGESWCAACGGRLGTKKTSTNDGKYVHPGVRMTSYAASFHSPHSAPVRMSGVSLELALATGDRNRRTRPGFRSPGRGR
jgi:hypothetical protein